MQPEADQDADDVKSLLRLLEASARNPSSLEGLTTHERQRLLAACGRLIGSTKGERRQQRRKARSQSALQRREREAVALRAAAIRRARSDHKVDNDALPLHALPLHALPRHGQASRKEQQSESQLRASHVPQELAAARTCYVCKSAYTTVHFFYDSMCLSCGDFNYQKRNEQTDLSGRVALVTGGRVKIGAEIVHKLLRCGARVIVTTRFAADAAKRYSEHPDYALFRDRLQIYGLDMRHTPSIEALCRKLCGSLDRLDFLINNACQTVRRPAAFYQHLMANERRANRALSDQAQALLGPAQPKLSDDLQPVENPATDHQTAAEMSQFLVLDEDRQYDLNLFPKNTYDADQQQVDLRKMNSWRLRLHQVSTPELLEVQLVNSIAPFVLNARLKPLMEQVKTQDKHIVNVSAVEGQFARGTKTDKHPHTNMAKAALNMMTRTSAPDYLRSGIHMNSVDTGWVTDEDPAEHARRKELQGFQPPLDIIDGAARVCDPIIHGLQTGKHLHGRFLKDYREVAW
jgi:NAD(P)-dependent dehydrogenase (short-subunit alcohol dehydrogenase family)